MKWLTGIWAWITCAGLCLAQTPVHAVILTKPDAGSGVAVVEVRPHFVTAIRTPEPVNSVAVGDPQLFKVEHSPREPELVFVKVITSKPCESNLLISTGNGQETSLLLVSKGESGRQVDFVLKYQQTRSFLIEPDYPSAFVGETVPADGSAAGTQPAAITDSPLGVSPQPVAPRAASDPPTGVSTLPVRSNSLDVLLVRQEHAPLPTLYGEHPTSENPAGARVKAGISEVIDGGQDVIVLFSVVNPTDHAILLVPPQVQLGGEIRKGKIFRHWQWTTAEQLQVEGFRLSKWRLAPGERGDGVVEFERPPYKQSNETLFLQVAEAGAIDKPALAPIGFGVNKLRVEEATNGRIGK
ncbi:MAG TPA: hypothetical protein VMI06_15315 [Terriglobia bacterium]|nr:hypothetical protein [Terriglobia bacterium]